MCLIDNVSNRHLIIVLSLYMHRWLPRYPIQLYLPGWFSRFDQMPVFQDGPNLEIGFAVELQN